MPDRISVDMSDVAELSADLREHIPRELFRHVHAVVKRAANNVKGQMRADFERSTHFSAVAGTIGYRTTEHSAFGVGVIGADVGPDADRGGAGQLRDERNSANDFDYTTSAAPLAHIAWYGGADGRGGSDVLRLPEQYAAEEAPKFERALDDIVGEVFG